MTIICDDDGDKDCNDDDGGGYDDNQMQLGDYDNDHTLKYCTLIPIINVSPCR